VYLLLTFGAHRLPVDTAEGVVTKDAVVWDDIPKKKSAPSTFIYIFIVVYLYLFSLLFVVKEW
jgi:hypothetical protein